MCVFWYVSDVFVEDLVWILWIVCFVVWFVDFMVVDEMFVLMWWMVDVGEVDVFVFECVW